MSGLSEIWFAQWPSSDPRTLRFVGRDHSECSQVTRCGADPLIHAAASNQTAALSLGKIHEC